MCIRYGQPLISKDYNYTNTKINVQQILIVTFEFTGAARGFTIMSCAARGVKRLDSTAVELNAGLRLGGLSLGYWRDFQNVYINTASLQLYKRSLRHCILSKFQFYHVGLKLVFPLYYRP